MNHPMRKIMRDLDDAYLLMKRGRRLVADARMASVRVVAGETQPGRIEIALYDNDPAWLDAAEQLIGGERPEFVIYHPEGTDS